jgi:two-component system phosphate regulon sensor histidine kinase PhoR
MEFLLYIVIAAIFGTVIFLAMRSVNEGMKARSELKRDGTLDKNREDQYKFESITPHEDEIETDASIEKDEQIDAQSVNIMDEIDDFLIVVDQFKNIKHLNSSAIKKFGNNLSGKHIATLMRVPELLQNIDTVLQKKQTLNMELELNEPSFQFFKVYIIPGPSKNVKIPDSAIIFLKDLTDIIKAQRFKSDFVANVSHELKTPLVSIKGFLETIENQAKDDIEAQKKFIPIMLDQANRMENLINDLLSLSRIELQEHIQPQEKVNLKEVLENVEDIHQTRLKEFKFKNNIKEDTFVKGDHEKLIEVFSNIIDNSIKYSEQNKNIDINLSKDEGKIIGNSYTVSIKDEGIGIPVDKIQRVTERFFRADAKKSMKVGGTGLGLAIVKHIVKQHRGDIEINSSPQNGTEMRVHLPLF